jgi:hypothetical protein
MLIFENDHWIWRINFAHVIIENVWFDLEYKFVKTFLYTFLAITEISRVPYRWRRMHLFCTLLKLTHFMLIGMSLYTEHLMFASFFIFNNKPVNLNWLNKNLAFRKKDEPPQNEKDTELTKKLFDSRRRRNPKDGHKWRQIMLYLYQFNLLTWTHIVELFLWNGFIQILPAPLLTYCCNDGSGVCSF